MSRHSKTSTYLIFTVLIYDCDWLLLDSDIIAERIVLEQLQNFINFYL